MFFDVLKFYTILIRIIYYFWLCKPGQRTPLSSKASNQLLVVKTSNQIISNVFVTYTWLADVYFYSGNSDVVPLFPIGEIGICLSISQNIFKCVSLECFKSDIILIWILSSCIDVRLGSVLHCHQKLWFQMSEITHYCWNSEAAPLFPYGDILHKHVCLFHQISHNVYIQICSCQMPF